MQQCRGLGMDRVVIPVVWPANGAQNAVQIADARQTAESFQRLLMRFKNVTELDPIVPLSDLPTA